MSNDWKAIDYYPSLVTFSPAVVGYLRDGDRVCLGVRKKVSSGLGENLIAGIGGKIGDSPEIQKETSDEAMDREATEEIGGKVIEEQEMGRVRFRFAHKPPGAAASVLRPSHPQPKQGPSLERAPGDDAARAGRRQPDPR